MKAKLILALRLLWVFLEPPAGDLQYRCIYTGRFFSCHRSWTYDGICAWHWNREAGLRNLFKAVN